MRGREPMAGEGRSILSMAASGAAWLCYLFLLMPSLIVIPISFGERTAVESAWPGDVVGVMDRRELRIGDSLALEPGVVFANIPRFAPEHFARVILSDPMKRKQLDAGLRQLTEEGAAQVFFTSGTDVTSPTPIVGAVGQLQFDVMMHRLAHEYGVAARLEKISSRYPRWITGSEADLARATRDPGRTLLYDAKGQPLLLFENEWRMRWALDHAAGGSAALEWEGERSRDGELARTWLRSKANSIEGGTSEVQLNVIAKRILGLPGA